MREFKITSELAIDPEAFWSACSMKSVNWELAPLVRMTSPTEWQNRPICKWVGGRDLFRSWILLFGFFPVDRHSFGLRETPQGLGFRESSSSWMNEEWNHERTILPSGHGCTVVDHVAFASRIPLVDACLSPVYQLIFRHRHRRLRKKYGRSDAESREA
jgi:hypothetical protein